MKLKTITNWVKVVYPYSHESPQNNTLAVKYNFATRHREDKV